MAHDQYRLGFVYCAIVILLMLVVGSGRDAAAKTGTATSGYDVLGSLGGALFTALPTRSGLVRSPLGWNWITCVVIALAFTLDTSSPSHTVRTWYGVGALSGTTRDDGSVRKGTSWSLPTAIVMHADTVSAERATQTRGAVKPLGRAEYFKSPTPSERIAPKDIPTTRRTPHGDAEGGAVVPATAQRRMRAITESNERFRDCLPVRV